MLNNIVIGRYYYGNSYVHKLNPVIKLISSIIMVTSVFLSDNIHVILVMSLLTLLLSIASDISLKRITRNIYGLKWFLLSLLIIDIVFGISYLNMIKVVIIITYTSLILYTTSINNVIGALNTILKPLTIFKININKLSFLIGLSISFIPNLIEQFNKILKSIKVRGIIIKRVNLKQKILVLKSMIIPIFETSLKRADALADLMELRMYNLSSLYVSKVNKKIKFNDIFQIIIHIMILILVVKEG